MSPYSLVRPVTLVNPVSGETITGEVDFTPPHLSNFVRVGTNSEPEPNPEPAQFEAPQFEAIEAGGEAPPIIVPLRTIRHAGSGKWHAYDGERRLTERPVTKEEAQAIADGRVLDAAADLG